MTSIFVWSESTRSELQNQFWKQKIGFVAVCTKTSTISQLSLPIKKFLLHSNARIERLGGWIATGGETRERELHHTSFFVVCLTVSEIDRIQSIIVGSFRKTNHCTNGLVLEPKAIQLRMSEPSGNSGRLGICAVNCKEKYKKKFETFQTISASKG